MSLLRKESNDVLIYLMIKVCLLAKCVQAFLAAILIIINGWTVEAKFLMFGQSMGRNLRLRWFLEMKGSIYPLGYPFKVFCFLQNSTHVLMKQRKSRWSCDFIQVFYPGNSGLSPTWGEYTTEKRTDHQKKYALNELDSKVYYEKKLEMTFKKLSIRIKNINECGDLTERAKAYRNLMKIW